MALRKHSSCRLHTSQYSLLLSPAHTLPLFCALYAIAAVVCPKMSATEIIAIKQNQQKFLL